MTAPARAETLSGLVFDGCAFSTIYVDPPWKYGNQATRNCTDRQYRTMSLEEIAALPIRHLATPDAHLYVWTTVAFQEQTYPIIRGWGFEPKSQYVWTKPQMGMGNYFRISHEVLLMGVRGRLPVARRDVLSYGSFNRTRHSAKPAEVRQLIETLSPAPRLELFARELVPGWTVWGDQVPEAGQ